jgi:uncharacterized protein (TIGR00156 family)
MKQKTTIILLFFLLISSGMNAQYTGPSGLQNISSVKETKEKAYRLDKSDELVRLKGNIIRQINYDTYEFKDETGTIRVEIKPRLIEHTTFNDQTVVEIIGEVDYDFLEGTEIEVEQILIIQ